MALTQIETGGIKDNAVTAGKIPANAVGTSEIAADAVTGAQIEDDAIAAEHVADDAIGIAQLSATGTAGNTTYLRGDNTWTVVDTTIADDSVAEVKLDIHNAPSGTDKYLKYTSNGMEWATVAQYTTPLTTRGDVLFRDASGDQRLAKGTDGQFLKIGANDPVWADVPAGTPTGGNSGANKVFWENEQTVTHDYTITNARNAGTWGPVTINSGVTVTIGDGEYWTIM